MFSNFDKIESQEWTKRKKKQILKGEDYVDTVPSILLVL